MPRGDQAFPDPDRMNPVLWAVQGLLALVFLVAGSIKLVHSKEALIGRLTVLTPFSPATIRTLGLIDVLGGAGLLLPPLLGVAPGLAVWAAVGLCLVMVGALLAHGRRGEWPMVGANVGLLALAAFVAYGRAVVAPF